MRILVSKFYFLEERIDQLVRFLYLLERIVKFFVRQRAIQMVELTRISVPDKFFHELVLRVDAGADCGDGTIARA